MDSTRIHVPCLSNIFAAHCSGVRETPLRFHSKLAACETETFIHQTFSSVFLSLFIFFSVNATRKPFLNALGKIFWRANYVSKRDALRGTFRLDAKTRDVFKRVRREVREHQRRPLTRTDTRAHDATGAKRVWYCSDVRCSATSVASPSRARTRDALLTRFILLSLSSRLVGRFSVHILDKSHARYFGSSSFISSIVRQTFIAPQPPKTKDVVVQHRVHESRPFGSR